MNLGRKTFAAPLAAFTLVAGGGIALAASGGGIPTPGGGPAPEAVAHRPVDAGSPTAKPTATPTPKETDEPSDEASASPSPSLTGLCKAYRAGGYAASTKNGNVNPAWSALEAAAGGAANVGSYCDAKLGPARVKPTHGPDADSDEHGVKPDKPAQDVRPAKPTSDDDADVDEDEGGGGSHESEHAKH
jgi:hypothetical protein